MIPYIGDFAEDATIYHYFNTFDSNDPSASVTTTNLIASDIFVYKDGSVTDIVTDGATVDIDFDSRTGLHKLTIDTSASADYSIGSDYMVMVNGITVDAGTINAGIFTFSIENRYNDVNVVTVSGTTQTANDNGADINAILLDTAEIGTAGAGLTNIGTIATVTNLTNLPTIPANWITAAGIAANAIGASELAADAVTEIQSGLATSSALATAQTDLDTITGTDGVTLATAQALYAPAKAGDNMGTVSSVTGNVDGNVTGSVGSNLELGPAEVNAEVDTALSDIHLDHLLAVDYDPATPPGTATALLNELIESDAGVSRFTVNALENGPSGSGASAAAIADAVWDEVQSGHTTAGTFGKFLDTEVSGVGGGGGDATAANQTTIINHLTDVKGATWTSTDTLENIFNDTNELQINQGNWLTVTGHATEAKQDIIDTNVDAILVDTGTTLPASIAAVPTATENADTLLNRDMSAVSDTNARSPLNALRFLRNKWAVSGTTLTVNKEDDATSAWTATVSTDATADPVIGNDPA